MKRIFLLLVALATFGLALGCNPVVGKTVLTLTQVSTPFGVQVVASEGPAKNLSLYSRDLAPQPSGVTFAPSSADAGNVVSYTTAEAAILTYDALKGKTAGLNTDTGLVTPAKPGYTITIVATAPNGAFGTTSVTLNPINLANTNAQANLATGQRAAMWKITSATLNGVTYTPAVPTSGSVAGNDFVDLSLYFTFRFMWIANCPVGTARNPNDVGTQASLPNQLNAGIYYQALTDGSRNPGVRMDNAEPWAAIDGVYTSPGGGTFTYTASGSNILAAAGPGAALPDSKPATGLVATLTAVDISSSTSFPNVEWAGY